MNHNLRMIFTSDYLRHIKKSRWRLRFTATFIAVSIFLVGSYFVYQMRDWIFLPELTVFEPRDGAVIEGSAVRVEGKVTPGMRLTVRGVETYSEKNGEFHVELLLPAGLYTIDVTTENRFGRKRIIERQVVVK